MNLLEIRIRDSAYAIEDMVEFNIADQITSDPQSFIARSAFMLDQNYLNEATDEIDLIVEELLNDRCGLKVLLPRKFSQVNSSRTSRGGKIEMVGFDDDALELKYRLTGWQSELQVIPIVGMGGIGKTTLARNLYDDSLVKYHIDVRASVTISQTYLAYDVLQSLLKGIGVSTSKRQENRIEELSEILYRNLTGRRYLIVLDDMWSTDVWDNLRRIFPDDNNGSRVMLTTRLAELAAYAADSSIPPHQMQLLNKYKSWDLLSEEAFGKQDCPPELEDIGKMIARNCKGLPLAISVIGGPLANSSMTREFWGYVAQNVNSLAIKSDDHCSEILSLSYNHLPHHLKPCFLYFGAFPEDHEISVPKLIKLWIAKGFLKPIRSKSLEHAAENYLNALIDRNLVFVRQKGSAGKTKTCIMHDLLRDLCIKEAQKENFLHIINRSDPFPEEVPCPLIMHLNIMESIKFVRSLLCNGRVLTEFPLYQSFILLRVLDFLEAEFSEFPYHVPSLVNLRYLALGIQDGFCNFLPIPSEISLLWKLQILIIQGHGYSLNRDMFETNHSYHGMHMPSEILHMAQLRHLQMTGGVLPDPTHGGSNSVVMKDLQTISMVANFRCTKEILKKFPNLRKLGFYCYAANVEELSGYHLENLVHFSKLNSNTENN